MIAEIFTDGGSRGNPGLSGLGVVIRSADQIVFKISRFLGIKTNNEAEYLALITALEWLKENHQNFSRLIFYADSELLVRQIQGLYKVKAPHLLPLYHQVIGLLALINLPYEFKSVPRELNSLADSLANQAMDHQS